MSEKKYPWYDNFAERENQSLAYPWSDVDDDDDFEFYDGETPFEESTCYDTPKKILEYLDQHVYKQDAAKKAAAMIAFKTFVRGKSVRENALFIGPSGCGKTYIWTVLKGIFPDRIEIVDSSNITLDGWKGGKKWRSLFNSPIFKTGERCILVLDEADKMLTPKFTSHGEAVSAGIQGEGLKLLEGLKFYTQSGDETYCVNTENITFVLCGAFNSKAEEMAEKASVSRLGFCNSAHEEVKAYEKPLDSKDLLEFGVIPEFLGRIQRIVNLERITEEDYLQMLETSCSPVEKVRTQYGCKKLKLKNETKREIAQNAYKLGLGVRGMENNIRQMLDDAIFEEPEKQSFVF